MADAKFYIDSARVYATVAGLSAADAEALAEIARMSHAAGVVEGIRQAREAVEGGGPWLVYEDRRVALDAIDALTT